MPVDENPEVLEDVKKKGALSSLKILSLCSMDFYYTFCSLQQPFANPTDCLPGKELLLCNFFTSPELSDLQVRYTAGLNRQPETYRSAST